MDIIEDTKIIFVDIDGTLTDSSRRVSKYTKKIIKKVIDKDILVVLCSGRPNDYTIRKSKLIKASKYVISNSGNLVYDYKNNEVIFINEVPRDYLIEIYDYCYENKIDCVFNGVNEYYQNKYSVRDRKIIKSIEEIKEPICLINVITSTLESAIEFKNAIDNSEHFTIGCMSDNISEKIEDDEEYEFDVICKRAGKGYGVKKLLNYLNIPIEETMCFGDYMNDYSMFKECDITVAMGNGTPKLKRLADYTTLTNDEDGVACFLEDNLL